MPPESRALVALLLTVVVVHRASRCHCSLLSTGVANLSRFHSHCRNNGDRLSPATSTCALCALGQIVMNSVLSFGAVHDDIIIRGLRFATAGRMVGLCLIVFLLALLQPLLARQTELFLARPSRGQLPPRLWSGAIAATLSALCGSLSMLLLMSFNFWVLLAGSLGFAVGVVLPKTRLGSRWLIGSCCQHLPPREREVGSALEDDSEVAALCNEREGGPYQP